MKIFGKSGLASSSVFQKHTVGSIGDHPHSARLFGKLSQQSFKTRSSSEVTGKGSLMRSLDDFRINGGNSMDIESNKNINFEPRNELTKRSSNGLERPNGFNKKSRM